MGREAVIASRLASTMDRCTSDGDWSVVRPSSLASQLPQGMRYTCQELVGFQAVIASRLASTMDRCTSDGDWSAVRPSSLASQLPQGIGVHRLEMGRLSGRHRWQASSHKKTEQQTAFASHHSSGRALARLQLLIWLLICPPLREAEWRCSSGEWRVAPFDAVEHAACRSKRSRPEGSVPGWIPERRNAEP